MFPKYYLLDFSGVGYKRYLCEIWIAEMDMTHSSLKVAVLSGGDRKTQTDQQIPVYLYPAHPSSS